jgi:hypothetical protein
MLASRTPKARRPLALARSCVRALLEHRGAATEDRLAAEEAWMDHGLITRDCGARPGWVPRELRHAFVSLLAGM